MTRRNATHIAATATPLRRAERRPTRLTLPDCIAGRPKKEETERLDSVLGYHCPARSGSVVRERTSLTAPPDIFEGKRKASGNRSTSGDHARLHRVQAAELSDEQVEAEHARPVRVEEILPLVSGSHPAPGDALVPRWLGLPARGAPSARRTFSSP